MSLSYFPTPQDNSPSSNVPLLARARYNNVAEVADELSFRQGDIVTVLKKDFNGQVDWWLCEMRGKVGMVPANYFEIFHDLEATYDVPRSSERTTPVSRRSHSTDPLDDAIYDCPPTMERSQSCEREPQVEATAELGNDYDFPPPEPLVAEAPDYDCPPSRPGSGRSSLKSGSASGILLHRLSQTSASSGGTSNSQIYDVPPELAEVYDMPRSSHPARGFEEEEKGQALLAVDIQQIMDDEAEEMLGSYCKLVKVTYENLFQTVYGSDAYWGTDNKPRRSETLQKTVQATKHFDRAMTALLEFGKGVANSLESSHDTNFKRKYASHYRGLLQKRQDILSKLDSLSLNNETTTATVKSLLENARTVPNLVNEFAVLVTVNKAVLFRSSSKPAENLPVITKSEVKVRPLPELPPTPPFQPREARRSSGYDYAFIPNEEQEPPPRPPKPSEKPSSTSELHLQSSSSSTLPTRSVSPSFQGTGVVTKSDVDLSLDYSPGSRKRNPQDDLPPLPYASATVPRPPKNKLPAEGNIHYTPVRSRSPNHLKMDLQIEVSGRQSPLGINGGDIIGHRQRSNCLVSGSRGTSPMHTRPVHMRNQSYDSNLSDDSSCDINDRLGLRRTKSNDLLDGPYGRATTPSHQPHRSGSPQPLRREDRELLERFSKQMELITPSLRESVDVLLDCIGMNEPPKDFVTKSKLTVVAAYKLVYVADALCQKILHNDTKTLILASSNLLTESIKCLVSDTKSAALQSPSVLALEKMGESLKQVFPSALELVESVKSTSTSV